MFNSEALKKIFIHNNSTVAMFRLKHPQKAADFLSRTLARPTVNVYSLARTGGGVCGVGVGGGTLYTHTCVGQRLMSLSLGGTQDENVEMWEKV